MGTGFEDLVGMMRLTGFLFLYAAMVFGLNAGAEVPCKASCPGGKFIVDLQKRCMCLSNGYCFKVDIGKDGPNMTAGGIGKTKEAKGAKYQTKPGPGNTGYDNDAISTGIPGNDAVGRWIHKTRTPEATEPGRTTKGCIAVPWNAWPLVKKEMGNNIVICGTTNTGGGTHMKGYMSGESDDDVRGNR